MDCPQYLSLPDFSCSPWIIDFNKTATQALINPFNGCLFETSLPIMVKGRHCLGCFQDRLLVFDEGTLECFFFNVTSHSKISLPPLLEPIESLGTCALSSQDPTDSTIMFVCSSYARFVVYCHRGDKEWTKYEVDFDNGHEHFVNAIFGSKGKMYLETSWKGNCVVINTTASHVYTERMVDMLNPDTCPTHLTRVSSWVESNGEIFLVRVYLHAVQALGVTNFDVHRLDTSRYVWRRVESIGAATFFLGANCLAVSSLVAGTQPDCIHLLLWCYDGIRLYSIRLDDRTISFSLLPACTVDPNDWAGTWFHLFWLIPPSFRQEPSNKSPGVITSKINRSVVLMEDKEQMVSPWSGLPTELIELLVDKLSFVDYLRLRAVCKHWSLIEKPIQHTRTQPMLMSIYDAKSRGMCRLFDPMVKRQYIVKDSMLLHGNSQTLRFSKYGWLLVTKGRRRICATNPFTGEVCRLPRMVHQWFNGIAFSSFPKSPDSIVFAINKLPWQHSVDIMVWRAGDKRWTKDELPCDAPFSMAHSNPLFFDNEFYCLGMHGNLGVFNPKDMTWRVPDNPKPVRPGAHDYGDRFCHLAEFRGDLFAVFRPYDANPIEMFKLDQSQMSWERVLQLDDAVLFLDNWDATIKSSQEYGCCNRVYLPFFGCNESEGYKVGAFYDLEDSQDKPGFYGMTEHINSLWIEPNFNRHM